VIESCSIITTQANEVTKGIHERMPVILNEQAVTVWFDLRSGPQELLKVLKPCPVEVMKAYPVSKAVNSPRNNGPECIEFL